MPPLRVAMAINYLHPFPGHRYAYNGCTDRVRKISASVSARENREPGKYVNYHGPVSVQITNEIFASRKKSPRNFKSILQGWTRQRLSLVILGKRFG